MARGCVPAEPRCLQLSDASSRLPTPFAFDERCAVRAHCRFWHRLQPASADPEPAAYTPAVAAIGKPAQCGDYRGELASFAVTEPGQHSCVPLIVRDVDHFDLVLLGVELVGERVR